MLSLRLERKRWTMKLPFVIAGQRYDHIDVLWVLLEDDAGNIGRGETCGVDYLGESIDSICAQLEAVRADVESGIGTDELQALLPAGGARNGLDCALWDLHSRRSGGDIWQSLGLERPSRTPTLYTIGILPAAEAAALARQHNEYQTLKIKADASGSLDLIRAVRQARPEAVILVDANQSWTLPMLKSLEPELLKLKVAVVEQPLPRGEDDGLLNYNGALVLAADESLQSSADLDFVAQCYQVANIKLDKAGGLTEALCIAGGAKARGMDIMVGNMCGSSLAMAPALLVAQHCRYVDLDGPLLQLHDCEHALEYRNGGILTPSGDDLWARM